MRAKLLAAMPGLQERAKTLIELLDGAKFLFAGRPLVLDAKALGILEAGGQAHIAALIPRLAALADWKACSTEAAVRDYAAETNIKLGDVAQPLRAALTGRATSPGIFDVLEVLGREEILARFRDSGEVGDRSCPILCPNPSPSNRSASSLADAHLGDVERVGPLHHLLFPHAVLHWRIGWGVIAWGRQRA